jgi:hypothetical protein
LKAQLLHATVKTCNIGKMAEYQDNNANVAKPILLPPEKDVPTPVTVLITGYGVSCMLSLYPCIFSYV